MTLLYRFPSRSVVPSLIAGLTVIPRRPRLLFAGR